MLVESPDIADLLYPSICYICQCQIQHTANSSFYTNPFCLTPLYPRPVYTLFVLLLPLILQTIIEFASVVRLMRVGQIFVMIDAK